jgi:4-hydroxyphenylpyruvate dioxygenase
MNATNAPTPNPVGLDGIDFLELSGPDPQMLRRLLLDFGFARTRRHATKRIDLYEQNAIKILVNDEPGSVAKAFSAVHGPTVSGMGWRVADEARAAEIATQRGATRATQTDLDLPAVLGIGGTLLYLTEGVLRGFEPHPTPDSGPAAGGRGFLAIDHLTNNVACGTMQRWASFYKDVFGFTEVRYFDIRGKKTGLTSYALRSPCGKFSIPINEASDKKSQINEYLDEHKGPGVQHVAFLTTDILSSLAAMDGTRVRFLDIEPGYYEEAFSRVPQVTEDRAQVQARNVLVDGDESGYLLQIFTKNLMGPLFIELIQRKNHLSFGEGNFGALFRSIERDQARRGVFRDEVATGQ